MFSGVKDPEYLDRITIIYFSPNFVAIVYPRPTSQGSTTTSDSTTSNLLHLYCQWLICIIETEVPLPFYCISTVLLLPLYCFSTDFSTAILLYFYCFDIWDESVLIKAPIMSNFAITNGEVLTTQELLVMGHWSIANFFGG